MTIYPDSLKRLPVGAQYSAKQGQASLTISMTESGNLEASADCDSLTLFITELQTSIFKLSKEKNDLFEKLNMKKVEVIKEPDGFQWFQIWLGRILGCLLILYGLSKINWKKVLKLF